MHLKLFQKKKKIQKTPEATSDLVGNKTFNRIKNVSRSSRRNNSETITNEHYKEIPKDIYIYIYIYPEERQKTIDNMKIV